MQIRIHLIENIHDMTFFLYLNSFNSSNFVSFKFFQERKIFPVCYPYSQPHIKLNVECIQTNLDMNANFLVEKKNQNNEWYISLMSQLFVCLIKFFEIISEISLYIDNISWRVFPADIKKKYFKKNQFDVFFNHKIIDKNCI